LRFDRCLLETIEEHDKELRASGARRRLEHPSRSLRIG